MYVRCPDGEDGRHVRWRSGVLVRYHKTKNAAGEHLLKVEYRDGTQEEYVDPSDVAKRRPQLSGGLIDVCAVWAKVLSVGVD